MYNSYKSIQAIQEDVKEFQVVAYSVGDFGWLADEVHWFSSEEEATDYIEENSNDMTHHVLSRVEPVA